MRIQLVIYRKEKYVNKPCYRWEVLPVLFKKGGCELDFIGKKEVKYFYFRYISFNPDIVVSAGFAGGLIAAFFNKLGLIKKPLVHDWNDDYVYVMGKKYGRVPIGFFEKFIIKNSDYIVTPSKHNEKKAKKMGKKVKYIPHGVKKDYRIFNKKLPGKNKVVYAGEISRMKNVDKLINAVQGLDCQLFLFGKMAEKDLIHGKNVRYMGLVKKELLPTYYQQVDILVLTMDNDCCIKMYEYILMGKPILALDGKVSNILKHKKTAYITKNLKEGLNELLKNKRLLNSITKNLKRVKVYSWSDIANKYIKHLSDIVRMTKNE